MDAPVELRPTIDRAWLEEAAARDPVDHAYALWDLDRYPDRTRFVSAVRAGATVGYLLIWHGFPGIPIVHWHGRERESERLVVALPARPLVAVVPPEAREPVLAARGSGAEYPELMMVRPVGLRAEGRGGPGLVRPLVGSDGPELGAWARRQRDPEAAHYPGLDPSSEAIWGAFDAGRLVGAARAAVRLPRVWIVAGVYVEPEARRQGFGERLVAAITAASTASGAEAGLYVREDRREARRVYERLGFRTIAPRVWLDLGAGLAP
jgi:ribosomal protein S18 acetylase RimI-like enzyme